MQMNTNEARTYGDFKADKKRKFPELFSSSSDDSDCENLTAADRISPQKANSTLKKLSEPRSKKPFKSKSSEYGASQQWSKLCVWWENQKQKEEVLVGAFLEPEIFDNISESDLHKPMEELMFMISHLQRAHLLSLYFEKLRPVEENLTHYEGGTLKGYVDSIVRMLQVEENKNHKLSSFYGNWSWRGNNEYRILEDTLSDKIFAEDHLYRGQKQKNPRTSDSVTASSFKLLIRRTIQKRDEYKEKNDLHNYVKTNAMVCVLIHTMFCGCRAEKEIGDIINTDFIDHTNNCIEFQQTSDHKGRRLGSNFNFLDRLSSFIFGQEYCEPFRIFLRNRPPNAIARFFLYALPSARFEDKFWLSANKPIGPKELGKAVSREIASMVFEGLVPHGMYTNTSLKKGLADRLGYARVPPVLIDLAVGHFSSKNGQASSTFSHTPNLPSYLGMWKQTITRKKIALLLYSHELTWDAIYNEDHFHEAYKNFFPGDFNNNNNNDVFDEFPKNTQHNNTAPDHISLLDSFDFDFIEEPQTQDQGLKPSNAEAAQNNNSSMLCEGDSFPDELFLSILTPPEFQRQTQTPFQASTQQYAQTNTSMTLATSVAPIFHIHGGTVNITFLPDPKNVPK